MRVNREYVNIVIRTLLVISITIGSLLSIYITWKLAYPFILGILFALMMNPVVSFLEKKWRFPRTLAVFTTLICMISLFAGAITLLIAEIVAGTTYLSTVVPEQVLTLVTYGENLFASQILPFYNRMVGLFKDLDSGQQDTIMSSITTTGNKIAETASTFLQTFFLKLPALISWIPNAATAIIFSLLATFFISKDWDKFSSKSGNFIPLKVRTSGKNVYKDLKKALFGFAKAQLTLVSITLVIVLIGLLILKVNYAITIALITGLAEVLPYLGTGTVFIPWIIYQFIVGNYGMVIGLSILYGIVIIQRQLMEPKILSSSIGMDPLATLVSLFVGFKLIGFLGLIVGPVLLVLITTLHRAHVFKEIWQYIRFGSSKKL